MKKLKLEDLKVTSFVTSLEEEGLNTGKDVFGGTHGKGCVPFTDSFAPHCAIDDASNCFTNGYLCTNNPNCPACNAPTWCKDCP